MSNLQVLITRLDPDLPLPAYAKGGDAGADIYSAIDITIKPKIFEGIVKVGSPINGKINFPNMKITDNWAKATNKQVNILLINTSVKLEGIVCKRIKLPLNLSLTILAFQKLKN